MKHLPALEVIQVTMTHKQLKAIKRRKSIVKKRNENHNKAKEQRKVLFMPGANKSYRLYYIR